MACLLHFGIYAILCFSITAALQTCFVNDTIFRKKLIVEGSILRVLNGYSPRMCMRECSTLSVCKSVNIYLDVLQCVMMLVNSLDSLKTSQDGMTIDAEDIPKEYAGECRDNNCLPGDQCVRKRSGGYFCAPYDFCTTVPEPYGLYEKFAIDRSRGVTRALYLCPSGTGYNRGERFAYCDPYTNTWTKPSIVCASGIPNGCGIPPPLPNTEDVVRSYGGNLYKAIYKCPSLSGQESVDHCPLTTCIGVETWTDANISCSEKDCYTTERYDGHMTCTLNRFTCQRWDQQTPHQHQIFEGRSDLKNYCQFTVDIGKPWCYTTDPQVKWQACPVPICGTMELQ